MDREAWLRFLEHDLAGRFEHRTTLWRAMFALAIAGASLAVFVARTFDDHGASDTRRPGVLMGAMLSFALYILVIQRSVKRYIRSSPPARVPPGNGRSIEFGYRLLNPAAFAFWSIGFLLLLLPSGRSALFGIEWLPRVVPWFDLIMFGVLGVLEIMLEGRLGGGWRRWRHTNTRAFTLFGIVVAGLLIVPLNSLAEALRHAEAGVALLSTVFIPIFFLASWEILRWLAWDRSVELLDELRFKVLIEEWDVERLRERYLSIEAARAQGPVPADA